jgi:hypothetical protein
LGQTQEPLPPPTPTPLPELSFTVLRPSYLPEEMTVTENKIPGPNGQGAGIEIHFDPHPQDGPHDTLTLTEYPKDLVGTQPIAPDAVTVRIGGRGVTLTKIGEGCVNYSWVQDNLALNLTNAYDPPGEPGQVRYSCEEMEKVIASIE